MSEPVATPSQSPTAATTASTTEETEPLEVLVALDHAPLIRHALSSGIGNRFTSEDGGDLGLTRFRLDPAAVDAVVAGLARLYAQAAEVSEQDAATRLADRARQWQGPAARPGRLDVLMSRLRAYFALLYAGWTPTMGKNRLVGQVMGGGGTVSFGGGPDPVPADSPAARAWSDGAGVTVAVLDTGIAPHPSFAGRCQFTRDEVLQSQEEYPFAAGHATFVAGLVLDQAPGATVRLTKVLEDDGRAKAWDVARAIVAHGRAGVDILNLSLVCYTDDGRPPLALAAAVDRLAPDVLVVACAGNHGDPRLTDLEADAHRRPAWPAALDDVVAVGSARSAEGNPGYELSAFTPPGAAWVDLVTQGEELESCYFTGAGPGGSAFAGGARWSGTSFAAARVTGAVAARASRDRVPVREAYTSLLGAATPCPVSGPGWLPPFLDLPG